MSFLREGLSKGVFLRAAFGRIIPHNPSFRAGIILESVKGVQIGSQFIESSELNANYWIIGNDRFGKSRRIAESIQRSDEELALQLLKYFAPINLVGNRSSGNVETVLAVSVARFPRKVEYGLVLYPTKGSIAQVRYNPQNPDLDVKETSLERFRAVVSDRVSLEVLTR